MSSRWRRSRRGEAVHREHRGGSAWPSRSVRPSRPTRCRGNSVGEAHPEKRNPRTGIAITVSSGRRLADVPAGDAVNVASLNAQASLGRTAARNLPHRRSTSARGYRPFGAPPEASPRDGRAGGLPVGGRGREPRVGSARSGRWSGHEMGNARSDGSPAMRGRPAARAARSSAATSAKCWRCSTGCRTNRRCRAPSSILGPERDLLAGADRDRQQGAEAPERGTRLDDPRNREEQGGQELGEGEQAGGRPARSEAAEEEIRAGLFHGSSGRSRRRGTHGIH